MKKISFIVFIFFSSNLFGQTDNYGTEFWTGFMENYAGGNELKFYICARQNSTVTISVPLKSFSQVINIKKDSVKVFNVPLSVGGNSGSEKIDKTGIHIVSDYPISVSAMNLRVATTDATIVLPLKNIPNNTQYVTGHPGMKGATFTTNEFLLVSPENGVNVEIIPTYKTLGGNPAFKPIYVTLNQGETYQVKAGGGNFDGSRIKVLNGKKIIAYGGDQCSNFPCVACDHQVDQVFPNQLLDTAYYSIPQWGHRNGYVVKVVSIDTTLMIKVNGKKYRVPSRDSSLVFDVPIEDSVLHISADRKFSCFEFMKGTQCNGYVSPRKKTRFGDPSILQLLSTRFMGQMSTFSTVSSNSLDSGDHFVSILIPTGAKNEVFIDGTKISPSEFIEVKDNKNFSYAKILLTRGIHSVFCAKGHLAYCYGVSPAESYLYVAGFSLPNFDIDIQDTSLSYNCKDNVVTMRFTAKLEGAIKDYHWDFGDGSKNDTTKIVTHKYPIGKDFTIKLWAIGVDNRKDSVIKKYNFKLPEFNPIFDKLLCDNEYIFEENNPFFTNFKWHNNTTANKYTATKTEKIWVTATDTSGYCKFSDTAKIAKVDVFSKVVVDTLSFCHLNNLFKFSDSSGVKNDLIKYKVWTFPGGVSKYDTSGFYYHFRQPGKLMVYLDIYPVDAPCKARIEIPVTVNWNTDIDAFIDKEKYCNGEVAIIKDTSYSCCQKVKKYYWELEDGTKLKSDSGKLKTRVFYDYKNSNGIINFNYITETEQGCRDTLKSGLIVWPAAKAKFDMGTDSIKCLALSRWTFTHTVDQSISGPYTMSWNFGNGKTGALNQYKNFRYLDTGIYKVLLVTTTNFGCKDSSAQFLKVINNAVAKFTIKDNPQCLSKNSFKPINNSTGFNLTYFWTFGNGDTSTLKNPAPISYLKYGTYKVKLKAKSNYTGCFDDSITQNFKVLRPPKADFRISADTLCFNNNSIVLIDSSKFYNGKNRLYWNYNNAIDSSFLPIAIHYSDTGRHTIFLKVVDSTFCVDSISKSFYLQADPKMRMVIKDTVQCFGNNNFELISLQILPLKNRVWRLNDVKLTNIQNQINLINISPQGFHKISLIEETKFGCTDSIIQFIEVLPAIKANFSINRDTQCFASQSFDFTGNSIVVKDLIKIYDFKDGGLTISDKNSLLNYKFKTEGDQLISFKISTENGCKDSITKKIFVAKDPIVIFQSDSVCIGNVIKLTAIQIAGEKIIDWNWNMGDGSRFDPIPVNFNTHTYKNAGTYFPQLTVGTRLGCYGAYNGTPIIIYPKPDARFTVSILSHNDEFSFIKLIPNQMSNRQYSWSLPNGLKNNLDTPTIQISKFFKDRIYLKTISNFGCEDTSSQFLFIFPKLKNLFNANAFSPNGDLLNETFKPYNIDGAKNYNLKIFNRWGELLFNSINPNEGCNGLYKNEMVQAGVYLFMVEFTYEDGIRYATRGSVTLVK